jgi:hypothetical protein
LDRLFFGAVSIYMSVLWTDRVFMSFRGKTG